MLNTHSLHKLFWTHLPVVPEEASSKPHLSRYTSV